jgi:hypothetical protein
MRFQRIKAIIINEQSRSNPQELQSLLAGFMGGGSSSGTMVIPSKSFHFLK